MTTSAGTHTQGTSQTPDKSNLNLLTDEWTVALLYFFHPSKYIVLDHNTLVDTPLVELVWCNLLYLKWHYDFIKNYMECSQLTCCYQFKNMEHQHACITYFKGSICLLAILYFLCFSHSDVNLDGLDNETVREDDRDALLEGGLSRPSSARLHNLSVRANLIRLVEEWRKVL